MKGDEIDFPLERTTLKNPSLIRLKIFDTFGRFDNSKRIDVIKW